MKQIKTLAELYDAAQQKRAVVVPSCRCWERPRPAGFLLNQQGGYLLFLFKEGMYLYEKKAKKEFHAAVRGKEGA